jgi:hypothetical protein
MRASSSAGIVAALIAIGCGGSGVDINSTESTVCSEVAEVACHNLYQCCTEGEIEMFLGVGEPRTELQCRDDVRRACERSTASLQHSIKEGRVRFEPEVMNNCLQSLVAPDGTCAEVVEALPWTEACMNTAWIGTVAVEGECQFSHECAGAPDAFCAPTRKCVAKPGHGQPCGSGCASDFYCSAGICQPRLPAGGVCTSTVECAEDLFCDTTQVMPVCTARGGAGAPCTGSSACESGTCIPGSCAGTIGDSCFEDTDCFGRCADDGSFCNDASDCAIGTCMMSGFSCSTPTSCGTSDTCIFPVQCLPGDCVGDPVCSVPQITVDYCEDAVSQLPTI